jgi:hypothetical protein
MPIANIEELKNKSSSGIYAISPEVPSDGKKTRSGRKIKKNSKYNDSYYLL